MVSKIELEKQFKDLGIKIQDDILNCAVDMCGRLFVDEKEMVETWMAYSLTNLNGAVPTVDLLLQMEAKEFSRQSLNTPKRGTEDLNLYNFSSGQKLKEPPSDSKPSATKRVQIENSSVLSQSPLSSTFSQRMNAGEVLVNFKSSISNWASKEIPLNIFCVNGTNDWMCMHNSLLEESKILMDAAREIVSSIGVKNGLTSISGNEGLRDLHSEGDEDTLYPGRILPSEGKLNINCIKMLSLDGLVIDVDMSGVTEYSLFPGQVVICKGSTKGKIVVANQLFYNTFFEHSTYSPPVPDPLQIVVACAPFTQNDSLLYEPLQDLIKFVKNNKPHVLILTGPIIDTNHPLIKNDSITENYFQFLCKILAELEETLSSSTRFFLVVSGFDVFSNSVYPTKPPSLEAKWNDIIIADPSMLSINGLLVGVTSVDIMMHLCKKEVSNSGERLARLASHVINQQSFYPLYPPELDVAFDYNLWFQHSRFETTPHILILPSDLHNFVKTVNNTIVINPGRLSKQSAGGTFACIEVQSPLNQWSPENHVAVKVVKI